MSEWENMAHNTWTIISDISNYLTFPQPNYDRLSNDNKFEVPRPLIYSVEIKCLSLSLSLYIHIASQHFGLQMGEYRMSI